MGKILVVEDEASLRMLLEHEFTAMGHEVILAKDGVEAAEILTQQRPGLIILDLMMPRKDGLEMLQEILNGVHRIPVIIHTAYTHYKHNFLTWAAESYIVKSSDLSELKAEVNKLLPREIK
jgi:DNA-binding response OmpR family regulator